MITAVSRFSHWLHTQWPAGKVEKNPNVRPDGTCNLPGVRIVGDLAGVPLLKFSADTGAAAVAAFLEEKAFEPGDRADSSEIDLAIIGAGVSGISAAIEAKRHGLNYRIYESAEAFSTIRNFPRKKPIYTYPPEMNPRGQLHFQADVKEALLQELEEQREEHAIEVENKAVTHLRKRGSAIEVYIKGEQPTLAKRVIIAIGRTGNFRKLNVPGENLDKVSNRLIDAHSDAGKKVLVVGGGDSALEAAIALAEENAEVTLSYRGDSFSRPKPDNISKIEALAGNGNLNLMLNSQVQDISESTVTICDKDGHDQIIENEQVYILIGREPPLDFFRRSGITVQNDWNVRGAIGLAAFFGLMLFLYHLKGYVNFLGIPGTNLWQIFQSGNWFPFNLPVLGGETGLIHTTLQTASSDPGFLFALAYSAVIVIFGIKRIRRRKTPYITRQTSVLMAFQVIPLFLLPYVLLPWMGANGAFTNGGIGEWFGMTFLSNGPGTEPDAYWRAFGFILAWPLFIYNVFTAAPLWGWLVVSLIQTFVIIPLIVIRWGKGAYCGWICSCGAMAETLGDQHRHKMPHGPKWNRLNMLGQGILALAFIILALRIASWLLPESGLGRLIEGLISGNGVFSYKYLIDLWLAGAIGYGLYFHFSGRVWCRFACPLAALMHIYARFSRFRIFPEKEKCISCNACTSVCHQGIDIMNFANKGLPMADPQCVRCSACVQICPTSVLSFGRFTQEGGIQLDKLRAANPAAPQEKT